MSQECVRRWFRVFTESTQRLMTQKGVKSLETAPLPVPTSYHSLSVLPSAPPTSVIWPRSAIYSRNLFSVTPSSL